MQTCEIGISILSVTFVALNLFPYIFKWRINTHKIMEGWFCCLCILWIQ